MYINPKQPKPEQEFPQLRTNQPKYVRSRKMTQEELDRLSRDYVLEHEGLTILSWDYVVENGKMFGESLWWDRSDGYYICDFSGDEEVYFTGLIYEIYDNDNLRSYAFYKDGLKDGVEVKFYPSGKIHYYSIFCKGIITGVFYEWYENGMIKKYIDRRRKQNRRIEADEQGKITKQGKAD